MRITFVLPSLSFVPIGGYKVVYQYANAFAQLGHHVEIIHVEKIATRKVTVKRIFKSMLIDLKILNQKNINWFKFVNGVNVHCVTTFDSKNFPNADVIVATAWQTANPVCSLPLDKGKKFYFIQDHVVENGHEKEINDTWKLPMTNIVIATWLKDVGEGLGVSCELVQNFVDRNEFYVTNPFENRKPSISMLYHEEKLKGSEDGIKALGIVLSKYPKIKVKLFGVSSRPSNLDPRIEYYEKYNADKLREDIYNKTSIFLSTSHSEGWGLTATEAMSCGNALVSVENGGVMDFGIEGKTALLSKIGDIEKISQNIEQLIEDDGLRKKLQKNSVDVVSKFSIESSSKKFLSILNDK